jgi:hypothetical protein
MAGGRDPRGRAELIASSSTVDIVSIPWRFFAVKYDQLDQLFLSMLSSAQLANDVSGLRTGEPEAALHAAARLSLAPSSSTSTVKKEEVATPVAKEEAATPEVKEVPIPSKT